MDAAAKADEGMDAVAFSKEVSNKDIVDGVQKLIGHDEKIA